jgi:glutaredoxin
MYHGAARFVKQRQIKAFMFASIKPCCRMKIAMAKTTVTLYTRPGCHLCEEAKTAMRASDCNDEFTIEEINIDEDPALCDEYKYDIPVVYINGVKAFKHRVDPREFRRKLRRFSRSD